MQEVEAKFLIEGGTGPEAALRRLQQSLAWAGFRIQPQAQRRLVDTYYDTPDHRLRAAEWSYRLREDGGRRQVALKALTRGRGAVFDRTELEQVLWQAEQDLTSLPSGPVGDRLAGLLQPGVAVAPLFSVRNHRVVYLLSHPDQPGGRVELAFDRVVIDAREPIRFSELEFEHRAGGPELLASLLAAVNLEPALLPARLSKFERGLIAAGAPLGRRTAAPRYDVVPDTPWSDLAALRLRQHLATLRLYEPYAWEAVHPDGVYQMCVAARRLRAALGLFRQVLAPPVALQLASDTRTIARALGAVRDLDAHRRAAARYRRQLAAGLSALDDYERHLSDARHEAHRSLLTLLAGDVYAGLASGYRDIVTELGSPSGRARHDPELRVAVAASSVLDPALRRLLQRGRALDARAPVEELHRLGTRARRLRDQLADVAPAYAGALQPLQDALVGLDRRLARHQDASTAGTRLRRFRAEHRGGQRERRALRQLIELERARAMRARRGFAGDWKRLEAAAGALSFEP